jgi:hypothetical protein
MTIVMSSLQKGDDEPMSLRCTATVALSGMVVVASIQAACAADLPLNIRPALPLNITSPVKRTSEPMRVHHPDAVNQESLFQQFLDWLQTRGYQYVGLDSEVKLAANDPAEAGLRMSQLR